jgi:iron-sulfur cluster assembly accessory protein
MTDTLAPTRPVTLTERAAARLAQIVASDPSKPFLRISVEGGGCSGFQYKFDLVEVSDADDIQVSRAGAVALIDAVSIAYMA